MGLYEVRRCVLGVCVALAIGCSGGGGGSGVDGGGGGGDTGTVGDGGASDGGGGGTDGGPDAMAGDGNDTPADADATTVGAAPVSAAIQAPGDLDYYTFTGAAGQWLLVTTSANASGDPAGLDTVVTLYDASMTQLAQNDDALPHGPDSELVTRLPSAGTYYLRVSDAMARGMASFTYQLSVLELTSTSPGVTVDTEPNDAAAMAQTYAEISVGATGVSYLLGTFDHASDVDTFASQVRLDASAPVRYRVLFAAAGPDGDGASGAPAHVRVVDPTSGNVVGQIDPTQATEIAPAFAPGSDLQLVVDQGSATADFYVLKVVRSVDLPLETQEATNGVFASAETLSLDTVAGGSGRTGGVRADLPLGDTDFFGFARMTGEGHVSVDCASRSTGSGVQGLDATILTSDGVTVLATATESLPGGVHIPTTALTGAGSNYALRLRGGGQDASVIGTWARCVVRITP